MLHDARLTVAAALGVLAHVWGGQTAALAAPPEPVPPPSVPTSQNCPDPGNWTPFYRDPATGAVSLTPGEGSEHAYAVRLCFDGTCPPGFDQWQLFASDSCVIWVGPDGAVPPPPTVDDLIPDVLADVVAEIPLPDIEPTAPPVEQGSLVNVPVWLAIVPPDSITARGEAAGGSVWAQIDAVFVSLTWDMGVPGTGDDTVDCVGPGTPWSSPSATDERFRESPDCGFTYQSASTPDYTGTGNYWFDASVVAHWELRLTGSDGRDVPLDPVDRMVDFEYVVFEVQTVGQAPG